MAEFGKHINFGIPPTFATTSFKLITAAEARDQKKNIRVSKTMQILMQRIKGSIGLNKTFCYLSLTPAGKSGGDLYGGMDESQAVLDLLKELGYNVVEGAESTSNIFTHTIYWDK